jgi:phage terminase large subunit-like protein
MNLKHSENAKQLGKPTWSTPKIYQTNDGQNVSDFAETFLHVSKGIRAGEPLYLTDWQRELLEALYERRPDGLLRYRRSLIGLARKNGKSLLGSLIALYALFEGESGAEVYSAAGDRQQARVVFNEAKTQITRSQALSGICKVYRDAIEIPSTGAIYRVLSSDAALQQGLNPSAVIFDELHVQKDSELFDALTLGSGARKDPQIVAITTAGYDFDTICGRLYNYGKRVISGDQDDERFGFFWWEAPEGAAIHDREAWALANPNLAEGLLDIEDMEVSMNQTAEIPFRRYRLNQWVRTDGDSSWLPAGAWQQCASDLQLDFDTPTFVGIDMALKHDSIAVVICQANKGRLVVRAKIWHPDGNMMDIATVEQHLKSLHRTYNVREFAYDPAFFQRSAEALADDGLPMVEFPQSPQRMVPAIGTMYEAIVNSQIAHDGDPMFTDQILSAVPRQTDGGLRLSKGKSKRKIDAAIACALAVDRATRKPTEEPVPGFFVV